MIFRMWGNVLPYERQYRGRSIQVGMETGNMANGFERCYKHVDMERMKHAAGWIPILSQPSPLSRPCEKCRLLRFRRVIRHPVELSRSSS